MWCEMRDVWCVVCGVWCVVCGVWRVVCGVWCVVCGALYCEQRMPARVAVCGAWVHTQAQAQTQAVRVQRCDKSHIRNRNKNLQNFNSAPLFLLSIKLDFFCCQWAAMPRMRMLEPAASSLILIVLVIVIVLVIDVVLVIVIVRTARIEGCDEKADCLTPTHHTAHVTHHRPHVTDHRPQTTDPTPHFPPKNKK